MSVRLLDERRAAALRRQELTYPAGGRPPGYAHFSRTRRLSTRRTFEELADDLLGWQVQARSGLRVAASSLRIEPGAVVVLRLGPGPASIAIPCRVLRVVEEPDECGFTYGTLPGHPESGEESFTLRRGDDGHVDFTIAAFSRPATALARLAGPLGAWTQRLMTTRYLHALERR